MLHHRMIKLVIFIIFIDGLVESQPLGADKEERPTVPGKSQAKNPFEPNSAIFKLPVLKTINLDFRNASETKIQSELLKVLKPPLQNKALQQEKLILNVKPPKNSNSSFANNFTSLLKNETDYLVPDGIVGVQSTIFKKKNGEISNLRLTLYVIRQKKPSVSPKSLKTVSHHDISPETMTEKAKINVTQTDNITATIDSVLRQLYENSTDNGKFQRTNIILSLISSTNFSLGQINNLRHSIRQIVLELYPNTSNSIQTKLLYKKKTHVSKLEFEIDVQSLAPKYQPKKIQGTARQKLNLTMKSTNEEIHESLQNILKTLKRDLQRLIPDSQLVVQAKKALSDDLNKLSKTLQAPKKEPSKIKTSLDLTNGDTSFENELDKLLPLILKKANDSLKPVMLAFKITIPNDATQDTISSDICFLIKTLTSRIPARTQFGDLDIELTLIPKLNRKIPESINEKLAQKLAYIEPESSRHVTNITKLLNLTEPGMNIIKKVNSTIAKLAKLSYNNTNIENQFNISLIIPQNETKQYVENILKIMQQDIRILFPYSRILIQAQDLISKGLRIVKLNIRLINELAREEKKADVIPIDLSKPGTNVPQELEKLLKPLWPYIKKQHTTSFDLKLRPVNDINRPRLANDICSIVDTLMNSLPKGISLNDIILETTVLPDKEQKLPKVENDSKQNLQKRVINTLEELTDELKNYTYPLTPHRNFTLAIQLPDNRTHETVEEIIETVKEDLLKLAPYADIIIQLQKSIENELHLLELNINLQNKRPIKKFRIDLNELGEFLPEQVDAVVYDLRNSKNPFGFALEMVIPEDTDVDAAHSEICSASNVVINNIPKESLLIGTFLRVTVAPSTSLKNTQNQKENFPENQKNNGYSNKQLENKIPFDHKNDVEDILPSKVLTEKTGLNRDNENSVSTESEEEQENQNISKTPTNSGVIDLIRKNIDDSFSSPSSTLSGKPIPTSSQRSQNIKPLENMNSEIPEEKEGQSKMPRSREINPPENIKEKPKKTNKNIPNINKLLTPPRFSFLKNHMSSLLGQNQQLHPLKTPKSDLSQEETISEVPKKSGTMKPNLNVKFKPKITNKNLNIPYISNLPISPSFNHLRIPILNQNQQTNPQETTISYSPEKRDSEPESPSGVITPIRPVTRKSSYSRRIISPGKTTAIPSYQRQSVHSIETSEEQKQNILPLSAKPGTSFIAEKSQESPVSNQIYTLPLKISSEASDITNDLTKRILASPTVVTVTFRTENTESFQELSSEIHQPSTNSYVISDEMTSRSIQEDWEPYLEYMSSTENPESQETIAGQPEDTSLHDENATVENEETETPKEEEIEEETAIHLTTEENELVTESINSKKIVNQMRATTEKYPISKGLQGIKDGILNGISSLTSAVKSIVQRKQTENPTTMGTLTSFTTETENIPLPNLVAEDTNEIRKPQIRWNDGKIPSSKIEPKMISETENIPLENFHSLESVIPHSTNSPRIELEKENIPLANSNPKSGKINKFLHRRPPHTKNKIPKESKNVNILKKGPSANPYPTTSEEIDNFLERIPYHSLNIPQMISKARGNIPVVSFKPENIFSSNSQSLLNKPRIKDVESPLVNILPKVTGETEDFLRGITPLSMKMPKLPETKSETENIPLANTHSKNSKDIEEFEHQIKPFETVSSNTQNLENDANDNKNSSGRNLSVTSKKLRLPGKRSFNHRRNLKKGPNNMKHPTMKQNSLTPKKKGNNEFPPQQKLIKAFNNDQKDVLKYVENLNLSNYSKNLNQTILDIANSAVKAIPRDDNETLELILRILPPRNLTTETSLNITNSVLFSLVSSYPNDIVNVGSTISTNSNDTIIRLQIEITISNNKNLIRKIEEKNNLDSKLLHESQMIHNLSQILKALVEDVKRETILQNNLQKEPNYKKSLEDVKSFLTTSMYTIVSQISSSVKDNSEAKNLNFTFSLNAPVVVSTNFVDHFKDLLKLILLNSLPFDDVRIAAKSLKNDTNTAIRLNVDLEPRKVFTTSPIDLDGLNILDVETILSNTIGEIISGLKNGNIYNKEIIINLIFESSHISSLNLDNFESALVNVFSDLNLHGLLMTEDIKLGLTKKNQIIIKIPFLITSSSFEAEKQEESTPKPLEIISDLILAI